MITKVINQLPLPLREKVQSQWDSFTQTAQEEKVTLPTDDDFLSSVAKAWNGSDYISQHCLQSPALLMSLWLSGDIKQAYDNSEYDERLKRQLKGVKDEAELQSRLRKFRRYEMVRIMWRDVVSASNLNQTLQELSNLADACIKHAVRLLYQWQCKEQGTPENYQEEGQDFIVIAVGKLGGQELNLSSDIDLIFCYPSSGQTQGAGNTVTHSQFFNRLGQRLISALHQITGDGFVFRVDMRLRPFGSSGALAINFSALENYYRKQGRDWERYAFVKARVVCGNKLASKELMKMIRDFVYRSDLDFSAIESLRQMHDSIVKETERKGIANDVKIGRGGIREIEFIGQTFQLIHGGHDKRLQERKIQKVLSLIQELELISSDSARKLKNAYIFLRNVEHKLQAIADRQTHELPKDEMIQLRVAFVMGYSDWDSFFLVLNRHRANVNTIFNNLVAKPEFKDVINMTDELHRDVEQVWQGKEEGAPSVLTGMHFSDTGDVMNTLINLRKSSRYRNLSDLGKQRCDALIPLLLMTIGEAKNPTQTLPRVVNVLEAIMPRSGYIALLLENPKALSQMVQLCSISIWIAEQLMRHPLLLGELLDTRRLYGVISYANLKKILGQWLQSVAIDDLDEQMQILRRFKLIYQFRVAAMDTTGVLPIMRVSDHLTHIACVILEAVQDLAWRYLVDLHGVPAGAERDINFFIVAYGKLGGIELGYGSDLDLVFLYDDHDVVDKNPQTNGKDKISNTVFYARLGQRILQMLSTTTATGELYEIDMRLRPMGDSGLLVDSIDAFIQYQHEKAWTWEHQALVRSRAITGSEKIVELYDVVKRDVLCEKRHAKNLKKAIVDMRQKMRVAARDAPEHQFDLKQGQGGITDIEFIAQYGVLLWAHEYPELVVHPDNIRILESFGRCGLMNVADVNILCDAYRAYRSIVHRLDLQNAAGYVADTEFTEYRQRVMQIWRQLFI